LWQKLTGRASRSAVGLFISNAHNLIWDTLTDFRTFLFGKSPPGNANLPLLSHWKHLASTGLPILVLSSAGTKMSRGEFDYLSYILGLTSRKSQVQFKVIEGAGHTFSGQAARNAVRQHTVKWLESQFPLLHGVELMSQSLTSE
jgi:hypothetical protein